MDLFKSIRLHNLLPAAAAGLQNLDLTIYLVKQLAASNEHKFQVIARLSLLPPLFPDFEKGRASTSCSAG
eukprot:3386479-Amphidinium_carterae.1